MFSRGIISVLVSLLLTTGTVAQDNNSGLTFGSPDLKFAAGTGFSFSSKDFLWGFHAGVFDHQNLWDAKFNVDFRPYYQKVITRVDEQLYQFKEKRFFISVRMSKYLLPLHVGNNSFGFYLQADPGWYLGNYRGANQRPESSFLLAPGGGIAMWFGDKSEDFGGAMLTGGYTYFKTQSENLPDFQVRISLSLMF